MEIKIHKEIIEADINCKEDLNKIDEIFKKYNITEYKINYDIAYDNDDCDIYYYCIAYMYNGKLDLISSTWDYWLE